MGLIPQGYRKGASVRAIRLPAESESLENRAHSRHAADVGKPKDNDSMAKPRPALGANLRRLRLAAGLTQKELAGRSGVARITIAKIESGQSPSANLDTIENLARALGVRPMELAEAEPEAGLAHIAPIIDAWLELEKKRPVTDPTDAEIAWLRALPGVFWLGLPPSVDNLGYLIEAKRALAKRDGKK